MPGRARWFDALVEQIRAAVAGLFPMVPWAPFSVETSKAVIPYVAGVRTVPTTGAVHVLVYFVPMSPRPVPVVERMIEPDQMFYMDLVATPGEQIRLVDLIAQMQAERRSWVPMVGEAGRPRFIVHQSLIDEFVCQQVVHGDRDVKTLTVHELLDDPCRGDTYRTTLAVVGPDADMDTALGSDERRRRLPRRLRDRGRHGRHRGDRLGDEHDVHPLAPAGRGAGPRAALTGC